MQKAMLSGGGERGLFGEGGVGWIHVRSYGAVNLFAEIRPRYGSNSVRWELAGRLAAHIV